MNRLQKIFTDFWSIQRKDLESILSLTMPSVVAGDIAAAEKQLAASKCSMMAVSPVNVVERWEFDDVTIPEGSVAVINLVGDLFSWEYDWLIDSIACAENNPKIDGIILAIDSPGGMVSHIDMAVETIRNCSKPIVTVVLGVMASAAFWIGSSTQRTFIASQLAEVGSIGVLSAIYSFREYLKQNGISYWEIYPDTADLKNKPYRELVDNDNDELIREKAEKLHKMFAVTVAENLGIEYDPELPLFRGAMFDQTEALSLGYADQTGGIEEAALWIMGKATGRKASDLY